MLVVWLFYVKAATPLLQIVLTRHSRLVYNLPALPTISFSLHTYLVAIQGDQKGSDHDLSPALHIAAAKVIELPSGISAAIFLLAFHFIE